MSVLDEAWARVLRDLEVHGLDRLAYLVSQPLRVEDPMAAGLSAEEVARLVSVVVGMRDGQEVGAAVDVSVGLAGLRATTAVLADCAQDAVESTSHAPWPACPVHHISLSSQERGDEAVWTCPHGDVTLPVGQLHTLA